MCDRCNYFKNQMCTKWLDYEIAMEELKEADYLCHSNWIEIQHLREYIDRLKATLRDNGIDVPIEYL